MTTIISCYSPSNANEEMDITAFYKELSSFIQHIHKHNILIIGGDMNVHTDKDGNDKFCFQNLPNRNGKYLGDFFHARIYLHA